MVDQMLVSHRLSRTREAAMMAMPTNTPGVVHLLAGSKDRALHRHITANTNVGAKLHPAEPKQHTLRVATQNMP
jgi:hypothetical protein